MRKDIDLNFIPHPLTGDLSTKSGLSAIQQSLKNLILTNYYERGFNIEIGSNVNRSLFENDTGAIQQTLKNNIEQVISNFEPDVELVDVFVFSDTANQLDIEIHYVAYNNSDIRILNIPLQRLR